MLLCALPRCFRDLPLPSPVGFCSSIGSKARRVAAASPSRLTSLGIAQTEHARIDVDLDAAGLPRLGKKFGVGKAGADHQQGVAALHEIPARLRAQQADGAGAESMVIGHRRLAEQRLGYAGAQAFGNGDDFLACSQRARANSMATLFAGI